VQGNNSKQPEKNVETSGDMNGITRKLLNQYYRNKKQPLTQTAMRGVRYIIIKSLYKRKLDKSTS
jgi:hypothetical protein